MDKHKLGRAKFEETSRSRYRWGALIILAVGICVAIIVGVYQSQPLDVLDRYEVEVTPQLDGTLDITYRFEWRVLNDSREGPLTWVKLGMANNEFLLHDTEGAIQRRRRDAESSYISFDLDREYHKGEVARFAFTVNQRDLMAKWEVSAAYHYDYTPGWFDEMEVKAYRFTWKTTPPVLSSNADGQQGDALVWEGSLKEGEQRSLSVSYGDGAFDNPRTAPGNVVKRAQPTKSEGGGFSGTVAFILVITVFFSFFCLRAGSSYRRGRGFLGHGPHFHGGGGGCACACAGCACACACAGGGRAGCSAKDFYESGKEREGTGQTGELPALPGGEREP